MAKLKRSKGFLFFYKFLQFIVNIFFKMAYRIEVINREKSFVDGGLILCSNHISAIDPIILCDYTPRPINFMAKTELFEKTLFRLIIEFFNAFPVNRSGIDRKAINTAVEIVKNGNILGIFPEGTRSVEGEIGEVHKGAALIAYLTKAPILPVALASIKSAKKVSREKRKLFSPKKKIIFGDPIYPEEIINKYPKKESINIIAKKLSEDLENLYSKINNF